jgi:hypothetical protein
MPKISNPTSTYYTRVESIKWCILLRLIHTKRSLMYQMLSLTLVFFKMQPPKTMMMMMEHKQRWNNK